MFADSLSYTTILSFSTHTQQQQQQKNKSVPKAGIRFGLNSFIKEKLRDENGKLSASKNFVAGLGAGVTEGNCSF